MSFLNKVKTESKKMLDKLCELKDSLYSHSHEANSPDLLAEVNQLIKLMEKLNRDSYKAKYEY